MKFAGIGLNAEAYDLFEFMLTGSYSLLFAFANVCTSDSARFRGNC
jgi:hypothetical protein